MKSNLEFITIDSFTTHTGFEAKNIEVSYEVFGDKQKLSEDGILICHALTGNSQVSGFDGWWKTFVGENKTIDTSDFPVIAFNVPGNGFDGKKENLIENYIDFNIRDIAALLLLALKKLEIGKMHSIVGTSLGGGLAWEMMVQAPSLFKNAVIIGAHYESTDWVIAHNHVQMEILKSNHKPLETARMLAMMFYRTPESFEEKFNRSVNEEENRFNVETYLSYQGDKLANRFSITAYRFMTHLLSSIDILEGRGKLQEVVKNITSNIVLVGIQNDYLFQKEFNIHTIKPLRRAGLNVEYKELKSIHGHDAFLIETKAMDELFKDFFI